MRFDDVAGLALGVRVVVDEVRGSTAVLHPEGVVLLNETAGEVLARLDGRRDLQAVAADLAQEYDGVTLESVAALVDDLIDRRLVTLKPSNAKPAEVLPSAGPQPPDPMPIGLLAELTYRCPLRCTYCSNPVNLSHYADELTEAQWRECLDQARALGVLQVHLSGGEPLLRPELAAIIGHARQLGLYTNLITSGLPLSRRRLDELVEAGLDHVQLSIQDSDSAQADAVAGIRAHARKLDAAALLRESGLPLTVNVVLHASNVDRLEEIATVASGLGAHRIELAHTQYYGWGLRNRAALLPTADQVTRASEAIAAVRARLDPGIELVYVEPDYVLRRPKPCMQGWGSRQLVIAPNGDVLPCLAAASLDLALPSVRDQRLDEIWYASPAFQVYRGTAWMKDPCRTCELRDVDFGGCRCQAYALTGDAAAADPVCELSPHHALVVAAASETGSAVPRSPR